MTINGVFDVLLLFLYKVNVTECCQDTHTHIHTHTHAHTHTHTKKIISFCAQAQQATPELTHIACCQFWSYRHVASAVGLPLQ